MNFEVIMKKYTFSILDHRIKTLIAILLLVLFATAGARFLEAPSGYRVLLRAASQITKIFLDSYFSAIYFIKRILI